MYEMKLFNVLRQARRFEAEQVIDLSKRREWFVDVSQTPANVLWVSGTREFQGVGGATVAAGQPVYLDTATNTYKLARATSATLAVVAGLSTDGTYSGRSGLFAPPGATINVGFTTTAGTIYCLSAAAAGGIAPWADLTTGNYVNVLFIGTGTANVELICKLGSVVHA